MDKARMSLGVNLLLMGTGLLLGACNSSTDSGVTPVTKAKLVGKWNFISFRYNVTTTITPKNPEFPNSTRDTTLNLAGSGAYQNLKADGTYEGIFTDPSLLVLLKRSDEGYRLRTGTWSVSGNLLTTVSSDGESAVAAVVLNGASATLTQDVYNTFSEGTYTSTQKGAYTTKATKQ